MRSPKRDLIQTSCFRFRFSKRDLIPAFLGEKSYFRDLIPGISGVRSPKWDRIIVNENGKTLKRRYGNMLIVL